MMRFGSGLLILVISEVWTRGGAGEGAGAWPKESARKVGGGGGGVARQLRPDRTRRAAATSGLLLRPFPRQREAAQTHTHITPPIQAHIDAPAAASNLGFARRRTPCFLLGELETDREHPRPLPSSSRASHTQPRRPTPIAPMLHAGRSSGLGASARQGTQARAASSLLPLPPATHREQQRRHRAAARPSAARSSDRAATDSSSSVYGRADPTSSTNSNYSSSTSPSQPQQQQQLFAPDAPSAAAARRDLFNSISPVYDELNDRLSFGMHRVWKRMAVRWALRGDGGVAVRQQQGQQGQQQKPRRALDVCCGSGDLALLLADALEAEWARGGGGGMSSSSSSAPLEVVGLDFAADMLADAARRERRERRRPLVAEQQSSASSPPRAQIQWMQGDAMRLPFPDASFDAATVGYGLRNVADPAQALSELARVLKPGGHLAVLDFNNARGSGDWLADAAQGFFLERVVVPEAEKYGLRDQYAYLRPSVHNYPSGRELERMARGESGSGGGESGAGFSYASYYPLAFGMMGCLVATR